MTNPKHLPVQEQQSEVLLLIPKNFLEKISDQQKQILDILNLHQPTSDQLGGFISESEAKKLLGKKSTWFWNMRTSGQLAFTKVGNTVYYAKADIVELLNKNKK